jgi:hypothetical protein
MGTSWGVAPHGGSRDDRKTATVAAATVAAATVAAATVAAATVAAATVAAATVEWDYRR